MTLDWSMPQANGTAPFFASVHAALQLLKHLSTVARIDRYYCYCTRNYTKNYLRRPEIPNSPGDKPTDSPLAISTASLFFTLHTSAVSKKLVLSRWTKRKLLRMGLLHYAYQMLCVCWSTQLSIAETFLCSIAEQHVCSQTAGELSWVKLDGRCTAIRVYSIHPISLRTALLLFVHHHYMLFMEHYKRMFH